MIGFLIVTHGNLAREFVAATEHVVGPLEYCEAMCIGPDDDLAERRSDIRDRIKSLPVSSDLIRSRMSLRRAHSDRHVWWYAVQSGDIPDAP